MGYYIRVLSTSSRCVPLSRLQSALEKEKLKATLAAEGDTSGDWEQLILSHDDGVEIAHVERNLIEKGGWKESELGEFADDIAGEKPESAVKWLLDYFPRVECIYVFQLLGGADHKNGWEIFGAVKNSIWGSVPSIIQADYEGFSNEDGYHILWQFKDSVKGDWWMGVLQNGAWTHFQMDLGNGKQRDAFFQGRIPEGVKLA